MIKNQPNYVLEDQNVENVLFLQTDCNNYSFFEDYDILITRQTDNYSQKKMAKLIAG